MWESTRRMGHQRDKLACCSYRLSYITVEDGIWSDSTVKIYKDLSFLPHWKHLFCFEVWCLHLKAHLNLHLQKKKLVLGLLTDQNIKGKTNFKRQHLFIILLWHFPFIWPLKVRYRNEIIPLPFSIMEVHFHSLHRFGCRQI